MSDETSGTPDMGNEEAVELAREPETIEVETYPMGEPSMDWRKDEIAQYMAAHSITAVNGLGSTKAEMLAAINGPSVTDVQANPAKYDLIDTTIPPGARGPVVARIRKRLNVHDGGDKFDAIMRSRVRRYQRWAGLTVTGVLDSPTRRLLGE